MNDRQREVTAVKLALRTGEGLRFLRPNGWVEGTEALRILKTRLAESRVWLGQSWSYNGRVIVHVLVPELDLIPVVIQTTGDRFPETVALLDYADPDKPTTKVLIQMDDIANIY